MSMMKYYSEISQIVNGALVGDRNLVLSYIQQLVDKLSIDGEEMAAKGLTQKLSRVNPQSLNTQSMMSRPVPVEKDSRFELADKTYPTLNAHLVFLTEQMQTDVQAFVSYITKQEQLITANIPVNPTLLLYGQPGTGKSQLAANIAAQLNLPLVTARADALISSYLGSTAKNIRSLLEYAKSEPCVLFLDEFDAIAKARDDKNEVGELKRVVVSLLQNIDNLGDTILIAATNHHHLLDPAIWRRFHHKMMLSAPVNNVRQQLIESLLISFDYSPNDIALLVDFTDQLTGAEIKMVIHDYLRGIIVNDKQHDINALAQKVLQLRFDWLDFSVEKRVEHMVKLKQVDEDCFNGRVLAGLWHISESYVSKLLKGQADESQSHQTR